MIKLYRYMLSWSNQVSMIIKAAKQEFPDCQLSACYFHMKVFLNSISIHSSICNYLSIYLSISIHLSLSRLFRLIRRHRPTSTIWRRCTWELDANLDLSSMWHSGIDSQELIISSSYQKLLFFDACFIFSS